MNTTENTTPLPHLNAIIQLEKSHAAIWRLPATGSSTPNNCCPICCSKFSTATNRAFTFEQCDLLEKRFYEIRVALDGE